MSLVAPIRLMRPVLPPLAGLVLIALVLHGLAAWNRPAVLPVTDSDRTILHRQIAAAGRWDGDVVLVGDSSCLMDAAVGPVAEASGRRVSNLGTFSYLGLPEFADLAARALSARSARSAAEDPPTVVLLLHPRFLRLGVGDDAFVGLYRALAAGRPPPAPSGLAGRVAAWSGALVFRDRIETRIRPFALSGEFGRRYGFNRTLLDFMDREDGGVVDPHEYRPAAGEAVETLSVAPRLEPAARAFRGRLPVPVRLVVGITPIPDTVASPTVATEHRVALEKLRAWLDADAVLGNLPAAMPADQFATVTHLNAEGRKQYSDLLGAALSR